MLHRSQTHTHLHIFRLVNVSNYCACERAERSKEERCRERESVVRESECERVCLRERAPF